MMGAVTPETCPDLATLEGSSCTDIMTCTAGCGYSFLLLLMMGAVTPETCPDLATLEGSSCTDIMTCTGGCGYSFLVLLMMMGVVTPETCRVTLQ